MFLVKFKLFRLRVLLSYRIRFLRNLTISENCLLLFLPMASGNLTSIILLSKN